MCVPAIGAIAPIITVASGVISSVNNYKEKSAMAKYQTQAALVNMKNAINSGYRERQEGIEAARKEKIEGLQKASLLMATNAAGGFDVNSGNNLYNKESVLETHNNNAKEIQEKYNISANNYFNKANEYFNQVNQIKTNANNDLFSIAMNGLGNTTSVAARWYKNGSIF